MIKEAQSRSQKAIGAHDSQASQKVVGAEHVSAQHQYLFPDIFWESKCCLIISYSAGTEVRLISCICVSSFLLHRFLGLVPPSFFLQVANINIKKTKPNLSRVFNATYFSQAVPHNRRRSVVGYLPETPKPS